MKKIWIILKYSYDLNGNVLSENVYDGGALTTQTAYTYDERNRIKTVKQGEAVTAEYDYDGVGNIISLKNSNGKNVTAYTYDKLNQLKTITYPNGKSEVYTYDNSGNLISKIDRKGNEASYTYDGMNHLLKEKIGEITNEYSYNYIGEVTAENRNGERYVTNRYNEKGQLESVKYKIGSSFAQNFYEYDELGNVKELETNHKANISYAEDRIINYKYDNLNRLSEVYENNKLEASYNYDYNGNTTGVIYGNGARAEYSYNSGNAIKSVINKNSTGNILSSYTYTYYGDGNQKTKADYTGKVVTYAYDKANRLIKESDNQGTIKSYNYNSAGNRTKMYVFENGEGYNTYYDYDENNQLIEEYSVHAEQIEGKNYYYDSNGNQIEVAKYISDKSNPTPTSIDLKSENEISDLYESYTYNEKNELVSANVNGKNISYEYSPSGLRYSKEVEGKKTYFGLMGDSVAYEYNADSSGELSLKASYLRGNGLISYKGSNEKGYYFKNGHGDIAQTIDTNGNVINNYDYDAFGNQKDKKEADINPFRYCGEYYDEETNNIYLRARYYNTSTGRFINEDPVRDGFNWYVYCGGNPVGFVDPSGKWKESDANLSPIQQMLIRQNDEKEWKIYAGVLGEGNNYYLNALFSGNKELMQYYINEMNKYRQSNRKIRQMEASEFNAFTLDVPVFKQYTKNSCWLYSGLMVYAYNNKLDWTQNEADEFAKQFLKQSDSKEDPNGTIKFFNNYDELKQGLEQYGPLVAKTGTKGGHAVVVTGVYTDDNGNKYVIYNDPGDGTKRTENFNDFLGNKIKEDERLVFKIQDADAKEKGFKN